MSWRHGIGFALRICAAVWLASILAASLWWEWDSDIRGSGGAESHPLARSIPRWKHAWSRLDDAASPAAISIETP